jgi:hypothetical protein
MLAEVIPSSSPAFALCEQIGKSVRKTAENERLLAITLEDGAKLVIPLDAPSPAGPEMATLSGRGTFCAAWIRPDLDTTTQP